MNGTYRILLSAALGLIGLLLATGCGSGPAQPAPSPPAEATPAPVELTPEDLLAASLSPDDVATLFPQPNSWWAFFPEFNVGFNPASSGPVAGSRFYVVQNYQEVSGVSDGQVQTTLNLFQDETSAADWFRASADSNDKGGVSVEGPAVGDEWRYFHRNKSDADGPSTAPQFESTLRFRAHLIVGRVSVFSSSGYEEAANLADYAAPVVKRIGALIDGSLRASPPPERIARLMPSESAARDIGPIFGSSVAPAESWALIDLTGDPWGVRDQLRNLGATELGFRRYGLAADPDQVIEITLFPLEDSKAAAKWVQGFIDQAHEGALRPANTGDLSAFTSYDGSTYELQFAKGRVVGDVTCFAPFADTAATCEAPVKALAEQWYAELPAGD